MLIVTSAVQLEKEMSLSILQDRTLGQSHKPKPNGARSMAGLGVFMVAAAAIAVLTLALRGLPDALFSWDAAPLAITGFLLTVFLCVAIAGRSAEANSFRGVAFTLWWFLLGSQVFFLRFGTSESAYLEQFSFEAYAELIFWVALCLGLLIATIRNPCYLKNMFVGPYKWLTFYGLVCLGSVVLSPRPAFSLAWAFKLALGILILNLIASLIATPYDLRAFLNVTFWGFAFLTFAPILQTLSDPATAFENGRLGGSVVPDAQSALAGTFLLLVLTFYAIRPRRWLFFVGGLAVVAMLLPGGKAAIAAAILAGFLFFFLQRRFGAVAGIGAAFSSIAILLFLFTPLGSYVKFYASSGQAASLTGRTGLWDAAVPAIRQKVLLGHGFVASKFVAQRLEGLPFKAGHLHNGLLETAYNNGLVGLLLMIAINFVIVRALIRVLRRHPVSSAFYQLAAGGLAVYVNLLINALFNASFGGRVLAPFLMLMALLFYSERLATFSERQLELPDHAAQD